MEITEPIFRPTEHECENASNSYLMSLIAFIVGLPLPIINLLATFIFYLGTRKGTYFVRWHATQALLSQFTLIFMNSAGFWWTIALIMDKKDITNDYISYMITVILFNIVEFIATVYVAIETRKGKHISLWLIGDITNKICKNKDA